MITIEQKLSEIVNLNFDNASILNKYGLDFCCGGKISLKEACKEKNINERLILDELNAGKINKGIKQNIQGWNSKFLMDYIFHNHHSFIREKGPDIIIYLNKIQKIHGVKHPELKEIYELFNEIHEEILIHLIEEEKNFIIEKPYSESNEIQKQNLIRTIKSALDEHELVGQKIKKIISLSNQYKLPIDACSTYKIAFFELKNYIEDLFIHIHLENNVLFPKIEEEIE